MKRLDAESVIGSEEIIIPCDIWRIAIYKDNDNIHPDDCSLYEIEKSWGIKFVSQYSPTEYKFIIVDKKKFLFTKLEHGF
jgi:hypothetical protein